MKHVTSRDMLARAVKAVRRNSDELYGSAMDVGLHPMYSTGQFAELVATDPHNPELVVKVSPVTDPWWVYAQLILDGRIKSVAAPVIHGQVKIGSKVITTMERLHRLRDDAPNTCKTEYSHEYDKPVHNRLIAKACWYAEKPWYRSMKRNKPTRLMLKYGVLELASLCDALSTAADMFGSVGSDYHAGNFMVRKSTKQLVCIDPWYTGDDFGRSCIESLDGWSYGV